MALCKKNYNLQRFLPPAKEPPILIGREAGWAPEPVWTLWRGETSCHCRESNPGCPARIPSRHHGLWSDKNTRCIAASRPDRFTPGERAPGTHFILLQFGLTCAIYCRFRGVFLKANNSGLPPPPVTASERTQKKSPPYCFIRAVA
jgi:hypothetical protein